MRSAHLWIATLVLGSPSCLPQDRCDPGFREDHYACYPITMDAGTLDASTSDGGTDAGSSGGNPSAVHGAPCTSNADCGGVAPVCVAPMLPYCTSWNCMTGKPCPGGWTCIGVPAEFAGMAPGVDSACLKL